MLPIPIRGNSSRYQTDQSKFTFAQHQAFKKLPPQLVELVKRGVVTAQWALALPERRQTSLTHPNIYDLLADDIIKPADIAKNFDDGHLYALERSAMLRSILSDAIITAEQFSALNIDELCTLINPDFQSKLNHLEIRKKLLTGDLTVQDLMQIFHYKPSGSSISSSSLSSSSLSSSSSSSSSAPPASSNGSLTEAQQQAYKKLPYVLVEQIDKGAVTAQWALSLPDHLLVKLSKQNLCELLGDRIIEPVDITDHFNAVHFAYLEYHTGVRNLLREKVITPGQFAKLKRDEIELLLYPKNQRTVRSVGIQTVTEMEI